MNVTTEALNSLSPCDVAALKKCLEENDGDRTKCLREVEAFQQTCSSKTPKAAAASYSSPREDLGHRQHRGI